MNFFFANRGGGGTRRKRDYTPLSWQDYFDSMKDVYVNGKDVSFHQLCACIETKSFDGETGED